jgi:spoIIIJ-associated protein
MRDLIFEGRDVAEALQVAAERLGQAPESLRYIVLEAGDSQSEDASGAPARIAILHEARPSDFVPPGPQPDPVPSPQDPQVGMRGILRAIAAAADVDLACEITQGDETLTVRIAGPGRELLLADHARPLKALTHLLQRMYGHTLAPVRIRLECEGHREQREQELRALAQELAASVRSDGQERSAPALNSYERRLIHVALSGEPGLRTYSSGTGSGRRLVIAPAEARPDPEGADGSDPA